MNIGIFQVLFLSLFFMILILINASNNVAFSMMVVLILMASLVLYCNCKLDDMERLMFRLLLLSVMLLRIYIVMISEFKYFLPVLCIPITCCCILCAKYAHKDCIKMVSITSIMFSLLCFTFVDDYGQDSSRITTSNLDKIKQYVQSIITF